MGQQALAKAVEVSTSDTFVIDTTGTDQSISPRVTLLPNVFALAAEINDQITLAGGALFWSDETADAAFGTGINRFVVSTTQELVDITGNIATILGFTGAESVSGTYFITATYPPLHLWLPTHQTSDQNWWRQDSRDRFKGVIGTDGQWSGAKYTARDKVVKEWPVEHAYNSMEKADPTKSATDALRAARSNRCFEKIVNDAREMVTTEAASGNKNPRGLYFICNTDTYTPTNDGLPTVWDSGYIEFDEDGVESNYIYCSAGELNPPSPKDQRTKSFFDLSIELTSAVAPAWGWDIT